LGQADLAAMSGHAEVVELLLADIAPSEEAATEIRQR
jgi:hypothetical protein